MTAHPFARVSEVPNLGVDVADAARHVHNRWRSLESAERDGTADHLLTRKTLLENEPPGFLARQSGDNYLTGLILYLVLKHFPARPYRPRDVEGIDEDGRKGVRLSYYSAYCELREYCDLAADEHEPREALAAVGPLVWGMIESRRRAGPEYRHFINQLIRLHDRSRVGRFDALSYEILGQFNDLCRRLAGLDTPQRVAVARLLAGESEASVLGKEVESRGWVVRRADCYPRSSTRSGGRSFDGTATADASAFLMESLGARALQWGNTVTDRERAAHLRHLCEAFSDLAEVLGVPVSALGLSGGLALAVGARGTRGGIAHYEWGQRVINLTRRRGVGALAHEWAHYLDHRLGTLWHQSDCRAFASELNPVPAPVASVMAAARPFADRVAARCRTERRMTDREKKYWTSPCEIFARAFEKHLQMELSLAGRHNTYLVGPADHWLWPTADERRAHLGPFRELVAVATKALGGV